MAIIGSYPGLLASASWACRTRAAFDAQLEPAGPVLRNRTGPSQLFSVRPSDLKDRHSFKVHIRYGPGVSTEEMDRQPILVRSGSSWEDGVVYFSRHAKAQRLRGHPSPDAIADANNWDWRGEDRALDAQPSVDRTLSAFPKFCELPAEIRRIVYSMIFDVPIARPFKYLWDRPLIPCPYGWYTYFYCPSTAPDLAIIKASRQMRDEATECLYRQMAFWFSRRSELTRFLGSVSPLNISRVRKIILNFDHWAFLYYFKADLPNLILVNDRPSQGVEPLRHMALDELVIEFPRRWQILRSHRLYVPCHLKMCKWITKAVKSYMVGSAVRKISFVGGGFHVSEQEELKEVEDLYDDISYEDIVSSPVE
ncbi:hypothetical protein MMC24_005229 [Lignoscripta atroalba]|nr:hypothetical protein [Lignoscripta atroalba]